MWVRDKNNVGQAVKARSRTATLFAREVEEATEALFVTTAVDTSDDVQPQDLNDVLARFEGRISLASFGDYVILTSEGNDQGVWVDMSEDLPIVPKVYQLGITPPQQSFQAALVERESGIDPKDTFLGIDWINPDDPKIPILQYNSKYFYNFTYVRDHEVFGCESNPSEHYLTVATPDEDENPWPAVNISNLIHSEDEQATGINIYRSTRVNPDDSFDETLPFRWLGTVEKGTTTFEDNVLDFSPQTVGIEAPIDAEAVLGSAGGLAITGATLGTHITPGLGTAIGAGVGLLIGAIVGLGGGDTELVTLEELQALDFWVYGPLMRLDNDRMPPSVKQLAVYNDTLFGAVGDRLVYSDIRFGNLAHWAFPEVNEIRLQGEVTFCATTLGELRGRTNVLLFGSQNQVARLSGIDEADYAVDIVGHQGPVSPHAWTSQSGAIAYVGESGLFLTTGAQIQMVSDLALDAFFEDKKIKNGSVMFFQDNDMLFSVHTETENLAFKFEDGAWSRWDPIKMLQTAQMVAENETYELFIGENQRVQRILWNDTKGENSDWLFESQLIDFGGQLSNRRKRFSQLQMIAETEEDKLTLETWIDDETEPVTRTFTPRGGLYPSRVPIQRVGRRLKFRVSGQQSVKIQGLKIGVLV